MPVSLLSPRVHASFSSHRKSSRKTPPLSLEHSGAGATPAAARLRLRRDRREQAAVSAALGLGQAVFVKNVREAEGLLLGDAVRVLILELRDLDLLLLLLLLLLHYAVVDAREKGALFE